ncbi:hypothetical protein AK812_SmicGene15131 [Symbiodinium microadriaticum]|uniref:Uncharacterized protein n=1 Tax=Symbiodinium microadriaticum TaxID=2951 RepID=A0A1Q9E3Y2_SYMMI|nr:hypothetical protein AK812_SmicGene15131 [Symbiodinium microadriaticum]
MWAEVQALFGPKMKVCFEPLVPFNYGSFAVAGPRCPDIQRCLAVRGMDHSAAVPSDHVQQDFQDSVHVLVYLPQVMQHDFSTALLLQSAAFATVPGAAVIVVLVVVVIVVALIVIILLILVVMIAPMIHDPFCKMKEAYVLL